MPTTLGTLLKDLAAKAGVKISPELAALPNEIPDADALAFHTNLFNLEAGKNNLTLKGHYIAAALDPIDQSVSDLMDEFGLTDDDKTAIKGLSSTYAKPKELVKRIAALEAKKHEATKGTDKVVLQNKIDELNKEVLASKAKLDAEVTALKNEMVARELDYRVEGLITANPLTKQQPPHIIRKIAKELFSEDLKKQGATLIIDENGNLRPVSTQDKSMKFQRNNTDVDVNEWVSKVLAENKLLEVTPAGAGDNKPKDVITPPNPGFAEPSVMDKQLADLKA